jgi:deazaflavin-dependent oxidoreductase (nitroreductase family)
MSRSSDWNAGVINDFRAHNGKVGGPFEGAPVLLLHHRGRKSGEEFVAPVMYLPSLTEPGTVYVFATKSGAPDNPQWYYNLTTAGAGRVEIGTETSIDTLDVAVEDITGEERDRIYAEQARRYPGFAEYAEKTAGIRTIPVLALRRAAAERSGQ